MGVDTLMLSDALRARLFVHPLVVAYRLQDELGMECVLPYHTRDKNVLGIQSDLLAAHVLGVRNLFVSLSDPATLGDYPNTRTLSAVGVDGLVRILAAMNRGLDLAENTIGSPTAFVPLVGGDPHAADLDVEATRLHQELESGALGVVTPPQFDVQSIERFCDQLGADVPVIVGVLPLRSVDHAEYLHHEIPGIRVPEGARERLKTSTNPAREGLAMARELLHALPGLVAGAHVVPPYRMRNRAFNALEAIDLTARGETVEREATSLDSLAGGVFVGRQAEMGQLKAALEEGLGGSGRLVALVGEPGIGKTRTSEELATYASLRGAQVLWGRCYD